MFISGSQFVIFDPHETHLPDGMAGLSDDAHSLLERCPDQIAPFKGIFGYDPLRGWPNGKGTMFRCAFVRACVHACVRVCVRVCVRARRVRCVAYVA